MTVQWCNGAMTQNEEMKNANVRCKVICQPNQYKTAFSGQDTANEKCKCEGVRCEGKTNEKTP